MKLRGVVRITGPLILAAAVLSSAAACGKRARDDANDERASRVELTSGTLPPTAFQDPPDETASAPTDVPKPQRNDAEIVAEIEAAIAKDHALAVGPTRVTVACAHGEVTLTGVVKDEAARDSAERIARNTPGVLRVRDYLDTVDTAKEPGHAGRPR